MNSALFYTLGHPMLSYFRVIYVVLVYIVLVGTTLLLGGCFQNRQVATLPIDENLPTSWQPLNNVIPVNIDGDEAMEYLLYYTYNGSNGPVGAVIYNTESDDELVEGDSASEHVVYSYIPYAILPSYRIGAGQGFIAEYGANTKPTIQTFSVRFQDGAPANGALSEGAFDEGWVVSRNADDPGDALAITDQSKHLTWVWWEPNREQYGVFQIHATGRLETPALEPFNWGSWRIAPDSMRDITATYPLFDRSQICHRKRYIMVDPTAASAMQVNYNDYDLGLNFCYGVPESSFYPEGIVLAYLWTGDTSYWDWARVDTATLQQQIEIVAQSHLVRVEDLASYRAVYAIEALPNRLEVRVCAQVIMAPNFQGLRLQPVQLNDVLLGATIGVDAQAVPDDTYKRRWLLFTLRYEPPNRDLSMADRFFITNVDALPVSPPNGAVNCRQRLEWQLR